MYRVLIVEDELALRLICKKMKAWSECDFTIAGEASNGVEALKLLEKESYDLIFSDIRMPFIDGMELLRKLKGKGDTTPFVFVSSYSDFEYARDGLVLGAFDYLLKPIDDQKLRDLLMRVKEHIETTITAKIDPVMLKLLNELGVSAEQDDFIMQVALYCSKHYDGVLSEDDFADINGVRKDYFGKLFKQHFKKTFTEFRTLVKVAYAIELLRTGNYKAYEVGEKLGFSSYQYFNKTFKNVTGTSPTDYKLGKV